MNHSEILNESLNEANNVRVRLNCEFLHSCAFHCPGCFVYRKNGYDERQLDILENTVQMFRDNGMTFDEIILGPTDFFAAANTRELLAEPKFKKLFENGDVVLTFPTTLQVTDEEMFATIDAVNEHLNHPDQEIEALVVPELEKVMAGDMEYIEFFRDRLKTIFNRFNAKVDYAIQMNIMDTKKLEGDFVLGNVTRAVRTYFDTIVEFNPSFFRTAKPSLITPILEKWNAMLEANITPENKNDVTFTMANMYHAGYNELTYNFHQGDLYICPFIYENVFDKSESFMIPKSDGDYYKWEDFAAYDAQVKAEQYGYLSQTTECEDCQYVASCVAKHVCFYMKQYDIKDCMITKKVVGYYE